MLGKRNLNVIERRYRVAHLFSESSPLSSVFRYRSACNPHVDSVVFCKRCTNANVGSHENVYVPCFSESVRIGFVVRLAGPARGPLAGFLSRWEWHRFLVRTKPDQIHV